VLCQEKKIFLLRAEKTICVNRFNRRYVDASLCGMTNDEWKIRNPKFETNSKQKQAHE
jgi:hypothetical protein